MHNLKVLVVTNYGSSITELTNVLLLCSLSSSLKRITLERVSVLMVLFLSILGWSLLESLGRSSGRIDMQPAHKGWSGGGCAGRLSDA